MKMKTSDTVASSRIINATPFFYGWVVLVVGTLGIIMIGPSQTFTVSIFIDYFIQDLGISRATVALIYGLATIAASLLLPITGRLFDRHGARQLGLIAALGLGLACLSLSLVQGVLTLFMAMVALRFMGFGSLQLASNNMIALWFVRRRGMVMGLAGLSLGAGFLIFPALTESLISQFDWRGAWIGLGVLVLVVMLPVVWLFFRHKPEAYGLLPDGDIAQSNGDNSQSIIPTSSEENWTLAEARRTGAFWLFLIALSTIAMLMGGLVFHQLSLFEVRGLSREWGVRSFQITSIFTIIGNLTMGRLVDRYSTRRMLALTLMLAAGSLILVQTMSNTPAAFIYGALLGLIGGCFRVIDSFVWARYYGRRHLGSIRGATMIGTLGSTALGPYPLGLSFDYLGSYTPVLWGLIALAGGIIVSTFFIQRPIKPDA